MNPSVAGNYPVVVNRVRFTFKPCHPSSCLRHKELPGRDIPGFQLALPEAVQSPGSNIRQVEGSGAGSSYPAAAHLEVGKDTPKEELNALLASFPKTNDVKG